MESIFKGMILSTGGNTLIEKYIINMFLSWLQDINGNINKLKYIFQEMHLY